MFTHLIIAFFTLTGTQADQIGRQIWENESHGQIEGLTCWNDREEFASMGINHFIWYPANKRGLYEETFPAFIAYLQKNAIPVPSWLNEHPPCPWNSKKDFDRDFSSPRMIELRKLLVRTRALQTQFMAERLDKTLPKMIEVATPRKRIHVKTQFQRLLETKKGAYVLLDYYNFKGDGVSTTERYNGEGWGLLQVLEEMPGNTKNAQEEFVQAARKILKKRVDNAPKDRQEERWLKGWLNRLKTYE